MVSFPKPHTLLAEDEEPSLTFFSHICDSRSRTHIHWENIAVKEREGRLFLLQH